ncbi:MAG: zinc ABC transporter substrate-binding protein [Pseudomonadota bacterium]
MSLNKLRSNYIVSFLCLAFALLSAPALAAESLVVASIKPLHSLVAAVMGDTGTPVLLVGGMQSPHGYQLKPSQMGTLQHARIVFYISPGFETFLERPLKTLPDDVRKVALIEAKGVVTLKSRAGGVWEGHESHEEGQDPHIWLDIANAQAMVREIAAELGKVYPDHKYVYEKNAFALIGKLSALDEDLRTQLIPVRNKPYIVFHDAFQYFGMAYGLTAVGSVTLEPEQEPSARQIGNIREKIRILDVRCVFGEPQFDARLVRTVVEGTHTKTGVLDEQGSGIPEDQNLYFALMRGLADGFTGCLGL